MKTETTAYSLAAVLAALSVSPAAAVASHGGDTYEAGLSKSPHVEKPGKGIGRDKGGVVEVLPEPTVIAPVATPVPTVAAPPAPTPSRPAPKPAPTQSPRPAQPVAQATPQAPRSTPQAPRSTPQAPSSTPQSAATPGRVETPARGDGGSGDRGGVAIGAPGDGGSAPVIPGATPGSSGAAAPTPAARRRGGGRSPAPRVTGGLIDLADRSAGQGGGRAPGRSRVSAGPAPVTYREDPASGRRVYAVPTPDGRGAREVKVPGGVFGILPSAAIEARSEVRGEIAEGGTRRSAPGSDSGTESSTSGGVAETISQPLVALDDATGIDVPPPLAIALVAAMALAVGVGLRRELHRW